MQTRPIQLTDVIYNAADQSFDALVTIHNDGISRKYACSIDAPITMSFEDAAHGLTTQAMRRHSSNIGPYSEIAAPTLAQRAGRRTFDPVRWLENLVHLPGQRAA